MTLLAQPYPPKLAKLLAKILTAARIDNTWACSLLKHLDVGGPAGTTLAAFTAAFAIRRPCTGSSSLMIWVRFVSLALLVFERAGLSWIPSYRAFATQGSTSSLRRS